MPGSEGGRGVGVAGWRAGVVVKAIRGSFAIPCKAHGLADQEFPRTGVQGDLPSRYARKGDSSVTTVSMSD